MITRRKIGKSFKYYKGDSQITDKKTIERIRSLAIPPAWKDVTIASSPKATVQAKGYDAAGRLQSIYSPEFRAQQDAKKFERILRFAEALPKLRKQVAKDLKRRKLSKEKVLACIVTLIDEEFFRVGNKAYAQQNNSFGITTLRSKHATITTSTVTFDFTGKSGKQQHKTIRDPKIARIIKQLDEMPGYELFRYEDKDGTVHDLTSADVNAYIKQSAGEEFTAKDFRTWGGTLVATTSLLAEELPEESMTARKKRVTEIVKTVSKKLGNTPAVARSSYIDPRVFEALEDDVTIPEVRRAMENMRPKKYLSVDEQCVLRLLSK